MNYDEFYRDCKSKGLNPFDFLIPEEAYKEIIDDSLYGTQDIASYILKNERTARRWCKSGYIKTVSKNPWICTGLELKRTLFKEFNEQITAQYFGKRKN